MAFTVTKWQESRFAQPQGCLSGWLTGMCAMKQHKTLYPLHILCFGTNTIVFDANTVGGLDPEVLGGVLLFCIIKIAIKIKTV
jgi:hypothetical protein